MNLLIDYSNKYLKIFLDLELVKEEQGMFLEEILLINFAEIIK
jgi:hypothetical protein